MVWKNAIFCREIHKVSVGDTVKKKSIVTPPLPVTADTDSYLRGKTLHFTMRANVKLA